VTRAEPGRSADRAGRLPEGVWALDATGRAREGASRTDTARGPGQGGRRAIVCAECGARVTDVAWRTQAGGHHEHTFFNPAGIAFRIACFEAAPGCVGVGSSSDEFTWFAGHRWQVGVCAACGQHLGWHFDGPTRFVALIRDRIREQADEPDDG